MPADRVDAAGRQPRAEQLARQLAGAAAGDPVARGQRHDRCPQPRPERRAPDPARQLGGRPGATTRAAQPSGAMLDQQHADRWQLRNLMTPEPATRLALIVGELVTAPPADVRVVLDDLIDLILRSELAARAPMPLLSARLALGALPGQQLLRLRTRLRTPLLTRLRRVLRRRFRTRSRVPPGLLLEPPDPLLQPRDLRVIRRGQLKQEPNASLPSSVIDRLRFRAIHTPQIRRITRPSSLWRPTTERLRLFQSG